MVTVLEHPVLLHELTRLRDENTDTERFRLALNKISSILALEITRDLSTKEVTIRTPLEETKGYFLDTDVIALPVMRAGIGMIHGFQALIPNLKIAYIGLKRDEKSYAATEYHFSFPPNSASAKVIILEVMVATGGSVCSTIERVKSMGVTDITLASVISAPEGIERILSKHPDIKIFTAALDRELNEHKYIMPGLGDAGDRINGIVF